MAKCLMFWAVHTIIAANMEFFYFIKRFAITVIIAATFLCPLFVHDIKAQESDEYNIKAAFIYNFMRLTQWPPEALGPEGSPMVLCIVGNDPFGARLDFLRQRKVDHRAIDIKLIGSTSQPTGCHVVFLASSEEPRITPALAALKGAGVLTVGETEGFKKSGGMITLFIAGAKVRFYINDASASAAKLKLSSHLLELGARP